METNQVAAPKSSNNTIRIILIVVVALVVVCIVLPFCIIAILTLMGPSVANVFSRVTSGLTTP
jgi:hypothetical protein